MAQSSRRGARSASSGSRTPQLLVSIGSGIVALSGLWLWFVGPDAAGRTDAGSGPAGLATGMIWIHRGAAVGLAAVALFMLLRSFVWQQGIRAVLLVAFLFFVGVGFWSGLTADWDASRLWAETIGTKISAGISLGSDRPSLPTELREARAHLAVVPAALLIVAVASMLHYRRS